MVTEKNYEFLKYEKFEQDYSNDINKPKICCACPDTKKLRDECVLLNGIENCFEIIEAHKKCMKQYGYEI